MKGYCANCRKVIDETETYTVNHFVVCHGCFDKLKGNKVISFGTWKKMTRKERKASRISMSAYEKFHEANKDKECVICGMDMGLYEVHKINDGKYCFDGETVLLCGECITNNGNFNDLFLVASNVFKDNKDNDSNDYTYFAENLMEKRKNHKDILNYCLKSNDKEVASVLYLSLSLYNRGEISKKKFLKGIKDLRLIIIGKIKLDFFRVDYYLNRKESKPYLCQICKLCETCQNNFDYECTETNDFLYRRPTKESERIKDYERVVKELESTKTFTDKKDDELEKLVKSKGYTLDDKDHNALRG